MADLELDKRIWEYGMNNAILTDVSFAVKMLDVAGKLVESEELRVQCVTIMPWHCLPTDL